MSPAQACAQIAELLVPAMQFPDRALAHVELERQRACNPGFDALSTPLLRADVVVAGCAVGSVAVRYRDASPFILPEEQNLLDGIAHSVGLWLEREQSVTALRASEQRFRYIFDSVGTGLWEEDFSAAWELIDQLRTLGVVDLRQHLATHGELVAKTAQQIRVLRANRAGLAMHHVADDADLAEVFPQIMTSASLDVLREEILPSRKVNASLPPRRSTRPSTARASTSG